jgi:uncharacterized protein (TIGR02594 family)
MNANLQNEPAWIKTAKSLIGQSEIKGPRHNPLIIKMFEAIKSSWFKDDETPWCAGFVGYCLEMNGIQSTRSASARSYEKFGVKLDRPAYGSIVVFSRNGGGHVGFVVGVDQKGNLMVLGGNQGDMVKISPYVPKDRAGSRVTAYVWPTIQPHDFRFDLPVLKSDGKLLSNEA